jgi:hypothetical protein
VIWFLSLVITYSHHQSPKSAFIRTSSSRYTSPASNMLSQVKIRGFPQISIAKPGAHVAKEIAGYKENALTQPAGSVP